ncbi:MAG: DUF5689 domain-containing protein [Prevotella sp.]|nr:DUF5689 domain-containing protein [Prevotella sp.]MCM1075466.1 DUF5689 domain-containing protein [Ruminococcus sp.]
MKLFSKFSSLALMALGLGASLTSCQNDFDLPPIDEPVASLEANTTIAELKARYWQDAANYYETVIKQDEKDVIIKGRVISSDATGNIYKSLVIQDETGALAFSINQTGMSNNYRVGQEVVVNVTDLGIGKYAALQQIGGYGEYNGTPQVSFMDYTLFQNHTELNGFPNPECKYVSINDAKPAEGIYCIEADMGNLPGTPEGQRQYQSQLVIFRNVHFEGGGELTFAESDATTNRTLVDANGNTLLVRNSNYSSFRGQTLPAGTGDVMGILSYFNGTWQLLLRSAEDCIFESKGQVNDPYSVVEAIELQGSDKSGWVEGFIVGSVKAGVTDIDSNDKIIWGADAEMDNTLVIAPDTNTKDINKCLVLTLPQGSSLRANGNLLDNPGNYLKEIKVTGTFDSYLGTNGLLNSKGDASDYVIEGVTPGTNPTEAVTKIDETFDGSTNIPTGWTELKVQGNKAWYITSFNNNNYASMTGYKGTAPFESWLITPAINASQLAEKVMSFDTQVNGYGSTTSKLEVYVMTSADPATATMTKLNPTLATAPDSGYSSWVNSGSIDLSSFSGIIYIGFCYSATTDANYATWCVDNVLVGISSSQGGTTTEPDEPTGAGSKDEPYSVQYVMNSTKDETGVWVEGYIVGWIDGMTWSSGAQFNNETTVKTNIILGPVADANSTATTIPCAVPAGSLRDVLSLGGDPNMYKKHVKVKGDITKYFGQRGVKNISEYVEL